MPVSPFPEWTLTARWIFPVAGPPLEGGTITIRGDRLLAVEPKGKRIADQDLGNVALLPGLVNAHTHLDLSDLCGRIPPGPDFTAWLRGVIAHRRGQTPEQARAAVAGGAKECLRFGTTLVGDIAGQGLSWDHLAAAPLRAVVFYELLGLTKERAELAWQAARAWLPAHAATPTCRPGLSPHAPYSVRSDLIGRAGLLAEERKIPLAVHLAETRAELELLHHHRGPFPAFLKELGVWDPEGLIDSPSPMKICNARIPKLFVHGNYLAPSGRIPRRSTIIFCPRTHAAFGHPPHPFPAFLKRGVAVALGTDSLASNPDLDLLAEARFVRQHYPDVPVPAVLGMATLKGAAALGWADETGSLTPGKSADLVILPLPNDNPDDPHDLVLRSSLPVQAVLFRGQWVYQGNRRILKNGEASHIKQQDSG